MQCTLISSTLFERRRHVSAGVDTHEARSTHTLNISIGLARSMLHLRWREREDRFRRREKFERCFDERNHTQKRRLEHRRASLVVDRNCCPSSPQSLQPLLRPANHLRNRLRPLHHQDSEKYHRSGKLQTGLRLGRNKEM